MKKKTDFKQKKDSHLPRVNHQIKAPQVRLVVEGEGARIVPLIEALRIAEEKGLDLVEISPEQNPPVCKILDFGKWKFEQQKKKKLQQKNQQQIDIKEIKFKPKIGEHDYQIKLRKAIEFLEDGNKVKITLRFRGREISHSEIGMELIQRFVHDTESYSTVELEPKLDGRQILLVLAPKSKK